jgi:hypothetical protein
MGRLNTMIQRLNTLYSKLANAKPGERFINYYRYQKTKEGEGHRRGRIDITVGLLMIILSIPPGIPPGFLVSLAGLGLIAGRLRAVAVFLDRAEYRVRRAYKIILVCLATSFARNSERLQ